MISLIIVVTQFFDHMYNPFNGGVDTGTAVAVACVDLQILFWIDRILL